VLPPRDPSLHIMRLANGKWLFNVHISSDLFHVGVATDETTAWRRAKEWERLLLDHDASMRADGCFAP
jgi:hypothetical protein